MVEAQQPIGAVHDHPDRVEADRVCLGTRAAVLVEPSAGQALEAGALAEIQPGQGLFLGAQAAAAVARAPGLDLAEYKCPTVKGDQVDLAVTRSHVTLDDHEIQAAEMADRYVLAQCAQSTTPVARGRRARRWCLLCGHKGRAYGKKCDVKDTNVPAL